MQSVILGQVKDFIYRQNGSPQWLYSDHCGIIWLPLITKILALIILRHPTPVSQINMREQQAGIRPGGRGIYQNFTLQIPEMDHTYLCPIILSFFHFWKASLIQFAEQWHWVFSIRGGLCESFSNLPWAFYWHTSGGLRVHDVLPSSLKITKAFNKVFTFRSSFTTLTSMG